MRTKRIHRLFLLAGILLNLIPLFHHNLWFDEAYSVGMASQSAYDIYNIGIHDVHPLLYYDLLHFFSLPWSDKILAERLFSWLTAGVFSIVLYGILQKNYDEKKAFLTAFLWLFFPSMMAYAGEIRMYMLVNGFVSIAAVYGHQLYLGHDSLKNRILFSLFCILSAYTHYYGLLAAAVMNLILLGHAIRRRKIRHWLACAAVEIGCYLPWTGIFIRQVTAVRDNFWIEWKGLQSLYEMILFVFTGNLDGTVYLSDILGIVLGVIILVCLILSLKKHHEGIFFLYIYTGVVLLSVIASVLMHRVIIYPRYLLVIEGCLFLLIALSAESRKMVHVLLASVCLTGMITCINLCRINYDPDNQTVIQQMKDEMQPGDIILITNTGQNANSFAFFMQLNQKEALYNNHCGWSEESLLAYRAMGNFTVVDEYDLSSLKGRIWYISCRQSDKYIGLIEDHAMLNRVFGTAPSLHFEGRGTYKDFYYAAYLYQVNR